ncbi:integration host factor, actinobacterial type [Streptomyces cinereoruber]|uniref:integration host factor, actinobacterial type n=1 Tax=Streptomyces cinereoruber TaxID=67260 RepID=UPI003636C1F9
MGAVPQLDNEQRRAAWAKAVAGRRERAEVRQALKQGRISLREVLDSNSEAVGKMPVRLLLEALPGIGKIRARQLLEELRIAPSRRVRGLGPHQRRRLLERRAPHSS